MPRGRKKGQTYKRRTNAQIAADEATRRENQPRSEQEEEERRVRPKASTCSQGAETEIEPVDATASDPIRGRSGAEVEQAGAAVNELHVPRNPTSEAQLPQPDENVPFKTDMIPEIFRNDIVQAANEIRIWSKNQAKSWNQHTANRFSAQGCPWKSFEKQWPDANMKVGVPVQLKDFLLPIFARVICFLPDRMAGHHLRNGTMPCKWHGWRNECVTISSVLNPSGPRICFDRDCSVIYLFSGKFICKERQAAAKARAAAGGNTTTVTGISDRSYCFTGHCPEVLAHLPPNIRAQVDVTITSKRAFTTALANEIIDLAACRVGFQAIQRKLAESQKRKFLEARCSFYGVLANEEMKDNIDRTHCDIDFESVIPYPFPSRQYIVSIHANYERELNMRGGMQDQQQQETAQEEHESEFAAGETVVLGGEEGESSTALAPPPPPPVRLQAQAQQANGPRFSAHAGETAPVRLQVQAQIANGPIRNFRFPSLVPVANEQDQNSALEVALLERSRAAAAMPLAPKPHVLKRCMRCGRAKEGSTHCGGVARNTEFYCTSTEKHVGWIVPPGFEVGDTRPAPSNKMIKANWKQRKADLNIEDEADFCGWT